MSGRSLRLRMFVASALSVVAILVISGIGLAALFERHVERRARAELGTYTNQIAANLTFGEDGRISFTRALADPRFEQVFSGLYWQLQEEGGAPLLRSRSLWDHALSLPADKLIAGKLHSHIVPGPQKATLLVEEQLVIYARPQGVRRIRIAAALDRQEVAAAAAEFSEDMIPALAGLAVVLIAAGWLQVRVGLHPLEAVRRGVNAIRARRVRRLEGRFPAEVMPLVAEVNELLEAQEGAIERARTRAGDLAHGLKTPLSVLVADARKLRERGEIEIAGEIEELARTMQGHVERELARSRIAHAAHRTSLSADLAGVVGKLVNALRRTPRGEALNWTVNVPGDLNVAVDPADLSEIAGNLLDNAAKWAKSQVQVEARRDAGVAILTVRDDGQGVPDEFLAALGRRGARLDEQAPGSGLGLAIAREVLEAYGGSLELANDAGGGLLATVRLPAG